MFQRINPDELNGRQKEIYNFQKSAALLADYGFNCIKLADDWRGADFLAHHFDGTTTLKVQLKARLTIGHKYTGQELWMNFPCRGTWYLVPHDTLVDLVGQTTNWLKTSSWQDNGLYSSTNPSPRLLEQLQPYAIDVQQEPTVPSTRQPGTTVLPPVQRRTPTNRADTPSRSAPSNWRHPNLTAAANALTTAGYTCSSPPTELKGNYLTARGTDRTSITVRCPGRLNISQDQIGTDLHIVFPDQDGIWYLIQHDELVRLAELNTPWLESPSWRVVGWYSSANLSRKMRTALRAFAINAT